MSAPTIAITTVEDTLLQDASAALLDFATQEPDTAKMVSLLDLATTLGMIRAGQTYPEYLPNRGKALMAISSTAAILEHRNIHPVTALALRELAARLDDTEPTVNVLGHQLTIADAHQLIDAIRDAIRKATEVEAPE